MRTGRRRARGLAFQMLFELESRQGQNLEAVLTQRIETLEEETGQLMSSEDVDFALELVRGTLSNRTQMDALLERVAPAFPVTQMPVTDRVALELGVFELVHETQAPMKVVINEAVELAKTYGGENSGRFVNGVLGTIARDVRRREPTGETSEPKSTQR